MHVRWSRKCIAKSCISHVLKVLDELSHSGYAFASFKCNDIFPGPVSGSRAPDAIFVYHYSLTKTVFMTADDWARSPVAP